MRSASEAETYPIAAIIRVRIVRPKPLYVSIGIPHGARDHCQSPAKRAVVPAIVMKFFWIKITAKRSRPPPIAGNRCRASAAAGFSATNSGVCRDDAQAVIKADTGRNNIRIAMIGLG
jgi:hypothetical protein